MGRMTRRSRARRLLALSLGSIFAAGCSNTHDRALLPKPTYSEAAGLPGFLIECRNSGTEPVSPVSGVTALRVDGRVIESRGRVGSLPGGPPADVRPGHTWTHLVVLTPSKMGISGGPTLGASLRTDWPVSIGNGEHIVAFRCAGNWTEPVRFQWRGTR